MGVTVERIFFGIREGAGVCLSDAKQEQPVLGPGWGSGFWGYGCRGIWIFAVRIYRQRKGESNSPLFVLLSVKFLGRVNFSCTFFLLRVLFLTTTTKKNKDQEN